MSLLPETARRVTEIVARAQADGRVPSLGLAIVRDRTVLHFAAAGDRPRPDPKTQYRLGSITKTLTATMIMQLRDEGRLALDDPLHRHLPGTPVGAVTLRQVLGHVSGLQREPDGVWWERATGGDVDRLLAGLTDGKLAAPPYRRFHYSNLGYGLLGAVVQRITGEPWADQVSRRVLGPLGMKRTTYAPVEPYARGYVVLDGSLHEEPRLDAGAMAPAGQLWSTATDMARWAAFLADPAPALLSRPTLDEMCMPVAISDLESWTGGHGLGPQLYRVGERVYVGHGGSMPGYVALLAVHRPSRTGVVAFANAYGLRGTSIRQVGLAALTAVLDTEPEAPPAPWQPAAPATGPAAELTGRWWWMGHEYAATADGDDLVMTEPTAATAPPWRFAREAPDRWRGTAGENTGEVLAVLRGPDGAAERLDIATFRFSRDAADLA